MKLLTALMLIALPAIANETAKVNLLNVRLSPHPAKDGDYYANISVNYTLHSDQKRIKYPIVSVTFVAEDPDGKRKLFLCVSTKKREETFEIFRAGDVRNASIESAKQVEVDTAKYANGDVRLNVKEIYLGGLSKKNWKTVLTRAEVWLDGKSIGSFESPDNLSLKRKEQLPDDWYVIGKYPDKFDYK